MQRGRSSGGDNCGQRSIRGLKAYKPTSTWRFAISFEQEPPLLLLTLSLAYISCNPAGVRLIHIIYDISRLLCVTPCTRMLAAVIYLCSLPAELVMGEVLIWSYFTHGPVNVGSLCSMLQACARDVALLCDTEIPSFLEFCVCSISHLGWMPPVSLNITLI